MDPKENKVCTTCQGSGKCFKCGGAGNLQRKFRGMNVHLEHSHTASPSRSVRTCSECMGSGFCQSCHGTGKPAK